MNELLARIGGSHRKHAKQFGAFVARGLPIRGVGAASLGSKFAHVVIPDTTEARELLKNVGGNLAKVQWKWLSEGRAQ